MQKITPILITLIISTLITACGQKATNPTPPPQPPSQTPAESNTVLAQIQTIDLQQNPIPGMIPIATRDPNAFGQPVVKGEPTNGEGNGSLTLPADERLYVRAWDPTLKYYANNFYDIPEGKGGTTPLMQITMAPAASLTLKLIKPDQTPAANANTGLMLIHPSRGPWWPAEADSGPDGQLTFPSLPPGNYIARIKALDAGQIEIPGVNLPPGGHTDLGTITLK